MVQLILLRPGCTDFDEQARIQGALDIPLSEAGRQQAMEAAEKLRAYLPSAVYCSPCRSAEDTAALIGQVLGLKYKAIDRLQNLNQGLWQGMLVEEVRHKQPKVYKQWQEHPENVRPPEGEMLSEAIARVDEALEKLAKKHRNGSIAIVAPEPLASIVRNRVAGTELGDLWEASNGCEQFEILNLEPRVAATAAENSKAKSPANGNGALMYRGAKVHPE